MNKQLLITFLVAAIAIAGCQVEKKETEEFMIEIKDIQFTTVDKWLIKGTLYQNNGTSIVLLHMLDRDRNDWRELARVLQQQGYNVLAIDMRGHGESTVKDDSEKVWDDFTTLEFNDMMRDIDSAQRFLKEENISIIGASIGANVAINYAASNKKVGALVLLSPGEDYRGIKTEAAMREIKQPVFIVASEEDGYATSSSRRIYQLAAGRKELKLYNNAGHGTRMLKGTDLEERILAWLSENFPPIKSTNVSNMTVTIK